MPVSPKYETAIPLLSSDDSSAHSFCPSIKGSSPCRRHRRLPFLLSFPLSLTIIYLILMYSQSWLSRTTSIISPLPYLSHSGKGALDSTIELPQIQYPFSSGVGGDTPRRQKVKDVIQRTWELYAQEAWGWDEVKPNEGGGRDTRYFTPLPVSGVRPILRIMANVGMVGERRLLMVWIH